MTDVIVFQDSPVPHTQTETGETDFMVIASGGPPGPPGPEGPEGPQGPPGVSGSILASWTGDWDPGTEYLAGEVARHSGSTYLADVQHIGSEPPSAEWEAIAVKGDTGPQGPQGIQGATGATGPAGSQGPAGDAGPQGPQGPQGVPGPAGDTGPQGPAGPAGDDGPAGPQGPEGAQGPAGVDGNILATWQGDWVSSTAYAAGDVVRHAGASYVASAPSTNDTPPGTSWEVLAAKGDTGPQGAQGAQGPQGDTGAQGPAGSTGPQGPQGPQGDTGPQGPQGPQGDPGSTTLAGLTDVDLTTTPPDSGQALVYDGALWVPGAGGGGSAAPGTLVWQGDFNIGTTYEYGDVVDTDDGMFFALETVSGVTPSLPVNPFSDTFDRANSATVGGWSVEDAGWQINANMAYTAGDNDRLYKALSPDGTMTLTIVRQHANYQQPYLVFARSDDSNYYAVRLGNQFVSPAILKVVAGSETVLATLPGPGALTSTVTVTKTGSAISAVVNGVETTANDPSPLSGTFWGVRSDHAGFSWSTQITTFAYEPAPSTQWRVLERRWSLDALIDVQLADVTDGDVLAYSAAEQQWLAVLPNIHTHTASQISDSTSTGRSVLTATDAAAARSALSLGTSSTLNVPASGDAAAGEVVKGSDSRLTNARTPSAHASSHASGGSDAVTPAAIGAWKAWTGTQAAYDALGSYDSNTLYVVIG